MLISDRQDTVSLLVNPSHTASPWVPVTGPNLYSIFLIMRLRSQVIDINLLDCLLTCHRVLVEYMNPKYKDGCKTGSTIYSAGYN
jgi:hypothetical protein